MTFSGVIQLILGMILGIAILGMSGVAAGSYFFNRLSVDPDRPTFPEEKTGSSPSAASSTSSESAPPSPQSSPASAPASPDNDVEPLEPGAYRVRVTWPDGLSLRAEPNLEAEQIGSILYDQEMIVLRSAENGLWDRVRIPVSNREGWVKAGNAERIEEED